MTPKRLWDDTRGSSLIEFTVSVPLFLLLVFGLVQAGLILFTQTGLQHGVEAAARCASVNYSANQLGLSTSCFSIAPNTVTDSTIKTYAQNNSWGISPASATFVDPRLRVCKLEMPPSSFRPASVTFVRTRKTVRKLLRLASSFSPAFVT